VIIRFVSRNRAMRDLFAAPNPWASPQWARNGRFPHGTHPNMIVAIFLIFFSGRCIKSA